MKTGGGGLIVTALLGSTLLAGCTVQGPGNLNVHEVLLYGSSQDRLAWVYGTLSGNQGSLSIAGQSLDLRSQISSPLATEGSLSVAGHPVYKSKTSSLLPPSTVIQRFTTYTVTASRPISATFLVTGQRWYKLSGALAAGREVQSTAQPAAGLSGGALSASEAAALSAVLSTQGTYVVTVMDPQTLPDAPLKITPTPSAVQRTGLYLQPLSVVTSTTVTTSGPAGGTVTAPSSAASGDSVNFRVVASGSNALANTPSLTVASDQAALNALWQSAYGRQTQPPPTPIIVNQTAVGIFLGSRPTGGYSLSVQSVQADGYALDIVVNVNAPKPGGFTTQSLTSPWIILAVRGQYRSVNVVDQNGRPLTP